MAAIGKWITVKPTLGSLGPVFIEHLPKNCFTITIIPFAKSNIERIPLSKESSDVPTS
jgi:hypothetical protein